MINRLPPRCSQHRVNEEGEFMAYKMCRTLVPKPNSYIGLPAKRFFSETGRWYEGEIIEYYDPSQLWVIRYRDGDQEDWSAADMKKRVPTFVSGPIIDGRTEKTAAALRERTRQRKRTGRLNPVADALSLVSPLITLAESGKTFELPDEYEESMGTVWKLLRVSVEDDGSRWGAYIAADEADSVDPDDLRNFTMEELQDSYEIELAPLEDIETWIRSSAVLASSIESNSNLRRSSRIKQH